jgi:hypothetical protein
VIDGNYVSTLPIRLAAADTVIYLDLSPVPCPWGILRRRLRTAADSTPPCLRPHQSRLCPVRLRYRRDKGPRVRSLVAKHAPNAQFFAPATRRQIRRLLEELTSEAAASA